MKCQIRWIDQNGDPTPDDNEAEYIATSTLDGDSKSFPCCQNHYTRGVKFSNWSFDPIIHENIVLSEN
jgi:hypothetical protein